jgi:hypothetical protein
MSPSREEEEHFAKLEFEKRKAIAEKQRAARATQEREELKARHWMHCPKCGEELIILAMQGVEVDKCPSCSGLWLDAGELERLVEREGAGGVSRLLKIFR